ncbi:Uncharacterised protein [Yokenella regensburgei]|jgi:hypothetical protein|nr:Uncharacterised protein [Yokenella regensburgei]SUQ05260.1 Uncharacterised protein [Yokenella regensburgei]
MIVKAVIVVLALLTVYFFLIAAIDYVDKDQCLDKGGAYTTDKKCTTLVRLKIPSINA